MVLALIYILVLSVSFLCSLVSFRLHYSFHLKFFSVFLGITVLTEFCANYVLQYLHKTNYPVYNIYILIQGIFYAIYFRLLTDQRVMKRVIKTFVFLFPAFWLITTLSEFKLTEWNSYAVMAGDLFIVCCCAAYLYRLFTSDSVVNFWRLPEFWIAAGSIVFFSCELPITGMLNFMAHNYERQALILREVLQVLNITMYSAFTYAFLCPLTKTHITKSFL